MHLVDLDPVPTRASPARSLAAIDNVLRQYTILLAEDSDDLRPLMECILKSMGYIVIACADGQLASAAFHKSLAVDLLLTDYDMPGKTGFELAVELTGFLPELPVVLLTGTFLSDDMVQDLQARDWAYVRKPCNLSSLESEMRRLLTRKRSIAA